MRIAIALLALAAPLAGCATGPEPRGAAAAPARGSTAVIAVREVAFDGRTGGYLKVKTLAREADRPSGDGDVLTYWVYDGRWNPVGYYTRNGETFRLVRGELIPLGVLETERALRTLLGASPDAAVSLQPIKPPRTLDGDREAARQATVEAAKKKAEGEEGGEDGEESSEE